MTSPTHSDLTLRVEGMSCQHCVKSVKAALEAVENVVEATPDLAAGAVRVTGSDLDPERLEAAIVQAGFQVAK